MFLLVRLVVNGLDFDEIQHPVLSKSFMNWLELFCLKIRSPNQFTNDLESIVTSNLLQPGRPPWRCSHQRPAKTVHSVPPCKVAGWYPPWNYQLAHEKGWLERLLSFWGPGIFFRGCLFWRGYFLVETCLVFQWEFKRPNPLKATFAGNEVLGDL